MAAQAPLLTTQAVGNFFVEKYYNVLYQSPELLYHFYHSGSKLVRPNAVGDMCSDTTLEAIKQKIHLTGNTVMVDIKTVDSHKAHDGILVIVRGYLTGADNLKRRFTQTFFLAPQERGYYVLNDILRYDDDDDNDQKEEIAWEEDYFKVLVGDDAETTEDNNTVLVWEGAVLVCEGEKLMIDEVEDDYIKVSVAGDEEEETHTNITISNSSVAPVAAATIQEEAPKKSYATVVKAMRDNPAPVMVRQKAPTLFAVA